MADETAPEFVRGKYVVTAPYVTLKTMTPQGVRLTGFFAGAPVPGDVPEDQLKHHLDFQMITEVDDPAAVASADLFPTPVEMLDAGKPVGALAHERVTAAEAAAAPGRAAGLAKARQAKADKAAAEAAAKGAGGADSNGEGVKAAGQADAKGDGPGAAPSGSATGKQ